MQLRPGVARVLSAPNFRISDVCRPLSPYTNDGIARTELRGTAQADEKLVTASEDINPLYTIADVYKWHEPQGRCRPDCIHSTGRAFVRGLVVGCSSFVDELSAMDR